MILVNARLFPSHSFYMHTTGTQTHTFAFFFSLALCTCQTHSFFIDSSLSPDPQFYGCATNICEENYVTDWLVLSVSLFCHFGAPLCCYFWALSCKRFVCLFVCERTIRKLIFTKWVK
ncbi:MAG: hypothetical protein J3R72DRAFT_443292 [Linnemannia gamsii]|nr:MAG: hypothetical protein J3R72DRAFT_443292 [Linnemannia gamsii]